MGEARGDKHWNRDNFRNSADYHLSGEEGKVADAQIPSFKLHSGQKTTQMTQIGKE